MRKIEVGMKVTCKYAVTPYSRSAWNYLPGTRMFMPGMVGVVADVDVPCVTTPNGKDKFFHCVDYGRLIPNPYILAEKLLPEDYHFAERCALTYDNIIVLDDQTAPVSLVYPFILAREEEEN